MRDITKIGIIAGAAGIAAAAVHCIKKKAFMHGFEAGMSMSLNAADDTIDEITEKYNRLADEYEELAEDYSDLLDKVKEPVEEK